MRKRNAKGEIKLGSKSRRALRNAAELATVVADAAGYRNPASYLVVLEAIRDYVGEAIGEVRRLSPPAARTAGSGRPP